MTRFDFLDAKQSVRKLRRAPNGSARFNLCWIQAGRCSILPGMIRRQAGHDWLLISQVDHAYLAAEIASAWTVGDSSSLPMRELLIPAIRDHDEGSRDTARKRAG